MNEIVPITSRLQYEKLYQPAGKRNWQGRYETGKNLPEP